MALRRGVLIFAVISIVVGGLLLAFGHSAARAIGGYLLFEALLCLIFVLVEHYRYQPKARHPARLHPTGERMLDPTSGKLVEAWEDPLTGEREYRQVNEDLLPRP
ncbi:MAG TPA: hypothetical protein VGP33_15285 [Chloroflexota bacterium]|nr:hypothetical protein [Chloroflexota bacterium]